jgi:hypothetical protein
MSSAFGSGYDDNAAKTYADLAKAIKDLKPEEVNPTAYDDLIVMFKAMRDYLTGENERLTQLGKELAEREKAVAKRERQVALEKQALALLPRDGSGRMVGRRQESQERTGGFGWAKRFSASVD